MKGKSEKAGMRLVSFSLIVGFVLLVVLCGVVSAESYVVSGVLECSDTIENIGTVNTDLITNTLYNQNGIVIWQVTPNMDVNKYHLTDLEFYAMLNKNDNKLLILINSSDKSKALRGMIPSLRNEENQALSSNPDPAHHCHEYNSHKTLIYDVLEEVFDELKDKSVIASSASLSSNTIYRSSFTDKIFIFGYYIITTEYNAGWHCFHNWPWGDGNDKCKYNPECYECEYSDGMIEVTFDYSITNPKHYYVYGYIVNDNGEESKYTYNGNLWLHQVNCGSKHDVKYGTTDFPLQIILYGHKTWSKSGQMTWMAIDADSISATGHIHGVGPTTVDKSEQPDVLASISLQETPLNWPETPEQPNVAITEISASPDHVSPGDTVTITVDTCNNGAAGFADVGVTVWDPLGNYCNLRWQGYNFGEGEFHTFTYLYIVPDDAELGSYDVGAGAWDDCTGTCEGQCCPDGLCSGRHNDGLIRNGLFEVHEQPHVVIADIFASPDHVSPGDTVTITVDTCNNGAAGFADVGVTVWDPLGDYCNLRWQGYNFEEGETPTLTYLYTVPDDAELGSYDVGAGAWDDCTGMCEGQCCPDGLCSGRHNDGLIRNGLFKVHEQPNVAITNIFASPDHVSPSDTVTITVDTRNDGAAGFADVGVTVWDSLGDYCNLNWQGYNFEEGETPTLTYLYIVPDDAELGSYDVGAGAWDDCTGTCEGQCCPDGLCSGRHNDGLIRNGLFKVKPKIRIFNLAFEPQEPDPGELVKIGVDIVNEGSILVKTLDVYFEDQKPDGNTFIICDSQTEQEVFNIGSLEPGQLKHIECHWNQEVKSGTHTLTAVIRWERKQLFVIEKDITVKCNVAPRGAYVPSNRRALIVAPFFNRDGIIGYSTELESRLDSMGWQVDFFRDNELSIEDFGDRLNWGYGLIHITTHGTKDTLSLESFESEDARNVRLRQLEDFYTTRYGWAEVCTMFSATGGGKSKIPAIGITGEFIRVNCLGLESHPLVYLEACDKYLDGDMTLAFICEGAGAYAGFDGGVLMTENQIISECVTAGDVAKQFYDQVLGDGRSVGQAVDDCTTAHGTGCFDILDPNCFRTDPCIRLKLDGNRNLILVEAQTQIKGYVFYDDGTTPLPRANEIPVYLYQESVDDPIWQGRTNSEGYYICDDLTQHWDPDKTKKFRIEAKWENDVVRIHDFALIGSEVIRERRPESGYDKIPQDGMWEDIVFDDGDAARDYDDASVIFEAINDASNYIKTNYEYNPNQVDVYIHDWTTNPTCISWIDGAIHFSTTDEDYNPSVSYHEYGHAIHFQHGAGLWYPRKMQEGWAIYFESLFHDDRYAGDYLESNEGYCLSPFNSYAHDWGIVYARIFHDLYDDVNSGEFDNFDNGENRIWQTFMDDKVKTIDEFYNNFIENPDEREAVRSIYATKKIKAPDYNGNFINVDFPDDINPGDVAIIDFTVKNYATSKDSYDVILSVWDFWEDDFCLYGYQENGEYFKRIDIDENSELEGDFKGKVDVPSSGLYRILLAIVPVNWFSTDACCLDFDDYDNGWIHYKSIVQTITLNSDLSVIGECPIDLEIVDPDGFTINDQSNNIPGATYTESDVNGDGDPDDIILIPDRKTGDYQITVIPEPDAELTDTYTLEVSTEGTTTVLAENVPISEIPEEPYIFESTTRMCGDVNGDGKVTMSDVRKVFNRYLDPDYPLDLPWAADVNGDGKVTMSDVRKVFNRYLDPGYDLNCCCEGGG